MKKLLGFSFFILFVTACANNGYRYQTENNPAKWQNQHISSVMKVWGQPDQVIKTRSGTAYYAYQVNSGANFFNTTTNFSSDGSGPNYMPIQRMENENSLSCVTVFQTNSSGIITNVNHQGNNCGGEWVPKS